MGRVEWGPKGTRRITARGNWHKAVTWNKVCEALGQLETVFMASMADVFEDFSGQMLDHNGVPLWTSPLVDGDGIPVWRSSAAGGPEDMPVSMGWVRSRLLRYITPFEWLHFLLLTKRPELVPGQLREVGLPELPQNCTLGTSISNQETAERMIPALRRVKALGMVNRIFLSYEPSLGPIDWNWNGSLLRDVDWVIVGGESTNSVGKARPFALDWARETVEACRSQNPPVPVFVKQLGSNAYDMFRGKAVPVTTHDKKGGEPFEWPTDLQVQERLIFDRKGAESVRKAGAEEAVG